MMTRKLPAVARHKRMVSLFAAALACWLCATPFTAAARQPERLADIQREARIVADVMKSVLRNEMHNGVRVTNVTAQYLARQGVLISVRLNAPWLVINDGDSAIEINGQLNLDEIPAMVENILSDLKIDIQHYEPEALSALREMRDEQRELRGEQRELRAQLREERRELVRAEADEKNRLKQRIDALESELQALEAQSQALSADIDRQYQELRDYRGGPSANTPQTQPEREVSTIIAQAVCDYASTLKSLSADNFLTVALRRNDTDTYYAFSMGQVRKCGSGDIDTAQLVDSAYQYEG